MASEVIFQMVPYLVRSKLEKLENSVEGGKKNVTKGFEGEPKK